MAQPSPPSTKKSGIRAKLKNRFHNLTGKVDAFSRGESILATRPTPLDGPSSVSLATHEPFARSDNVHSAMLLQQLESAARIPADKAPSGRQTVAGDSLGHGSSNIYTFASTSSSATLAVPGPSHFASSKLSVAGSHADAKSSPSITSKDRLTPVLNVLSQVLSAATAATAFFPPAQSVIGGLASGVDMAKAMHQTRIDREAVLKNLQEGLRRIEMCRRVESPSPEMLSMVSDLERDIKEDIGSVNEAMHESWWKRLIDGDAQEMVKHYGKLSSSLSLFITQTVISMDGRLEALRKITADLKSMTEKNYKVLSEIQADIKFQDLHRVTQAEYNTGPPDLRRSCTPETREQILTDLMAWATDDTNTEIYWLSGMAGTGKTTISYSFCERLRKAGLLATSYFCSRSVASSTEPRALLPTVSYHIASYSPSFSQALLQSLRDPDNVNIREKVLEEQFEALILGPSKASSSAALPKRRVLVFDGADEASNMKEVAKLISLFLDNAAKLPFKVFISSRRDEIIRSEFGRANYTTHSTALILHDIEKNFVQADIRRYISERLGRFSRTTIPEMAIDTLVERSGTLFVYASVLCSFLDYASEAKVKRRLQAILDEVPAPTDGTMARPHDGLDQIYRQILSAAADNTDTWPVLLVILTAQSPLTAVSISEVLGFEEFQVTDVVSALHAVLTGSDSADHPITIFHASFRDFLYDESRGGKFYDLISSNHELLFVRCLQIMQEQLLMDNLCQASKTDAAGNSVDIQEYVSAALAYSCTTWLAHLLELNEGQLAAHTTDIFRFFNKLVLRWLECMAWIGCLRDAVSSLRKAELSKLVHPELCLAIMDARRLTVQCFEVIRDFPLEVYHSALVWLPKTSRIRNQFPLPEWQVTCGLSLAWDACESILTGHTAQVHCVDVSYDGKHIVSGSDDGTVRIWNVETGEEEVRLVGHLGLVQCVAFSPDGKQAVSGSIDRTVRTWNLETGQEEKTFEGHQGWVQSVSFSPDGKRIVSGSSDQTVRTWKIQTGCEDRELAQHGGPVFSVSFSPDGRRVASGSSDQTIRIWDIGTGQEVYKLEGLANTVWSVCFSPDGKKIVCSSESEAPQIWDIETQRKETTLEGHLGRVYSVSFSPDGQRVVSGSLDQSVRIWDVETGREEMKLVGHSNRVQSVAFSPDGNKIISGSADHTVRVWNINTAAAGSEGRKPSGHSGSVQSVSFSPDGKKVVSGSFDQTVRIWDVETGQEDATLEGHSDPVQSVSFSPDGRRIVSGSADFTVRIWNVDGKEEEKRFEGHSKPVLSVSFSPDGRKVLSGSIDRTVRIWDVETGQEEQKLEGHTDHVQSASFSPDGRTVVSGSDDRTVRIWNIETGREERKLEGPSGWVRSVSFSPNGKKIVAGADDDTVRTWDAETGLEERLFEGHSGYVFSVFFSSDGTQVTSCSADHTVRVWDIDRGREEDHTRLSTSPPADASYALTLDEGWLYSHAHLSRLWLLPQFHNFSTVAITTDTICLGFQDGRVLVIRYTGN